jgi:hypothetical protein
MLASSVVRQVCLCRRDRQRHTWLRKLGHLSQQCVSLEILRMQR